jgi:hypothetical protein
VAGTQSAAVGENVWAALAVDGAIDSTAAKQGRVCGVYDDVDVLVGDVAEDEFDERHVCHSAGAGTRDV